MLHFQFLFLLCSYSLLFGLQVPGCNFKLLSVSFIFLCFLGSKSKVACSMSFLFLLCFFALWAPDPVKVLSLDLASSCSFIFVSLLFWAPGCIFNLCYLSVFHVFLNPRSQVKFSICFICLIHFFVF